MSGAPRVVTGSSAAYAELRPKHEERDGGYMILSRWRVLDWYVDAKGHTLPVCACGRIPYKAFCPDPRDPASGWGWIEARTASDERRWWTPLEPKALVSDARVKVILRELAAPSSR